MSAVSDERQTGAEIEITAEMIAAGVSAYRRNLPWEATAESDDHLKVEKIYRAMALAARTVS